MRAAPCWSPGGPTLRLHAGLEAVDDLIADLDDGFARWQPRRSAAASSFTLDMRPSRRRESGFHASPAEA